MSDIEKALKDKEEDLHITNDDRLMLIDILGLVAVVLGLGKLYFNGKGKHNNEYAKFCLLMAKKFSNMPVEQEH